MLGSAEELRVGLKTGAMILVDADPSFPSSFRDVVGTYGKRVVGIAVSVPGYDKLVRSGDDSFRAEQRGINMKMGYVGTFDGLPVITDGYADSNHRFLTRSGVVIE